MKATIGPTDYVARLRAELDATGMFSDELIREWRHVTDPGRVLALLEATDPHMAERFRLHAELLEALPSPDAARRTANADPPTAAAFNELTAGRNGSRRRTSWTADELMRIDFPPTRWAVPGLVSEGVNLLVGSPKLGKSWLALNLGVAVASGGRALSSIPVDQGDVLYLALEDTGRRLQSRLGAVLAGEPAPARLHLATECEPLPTGGSLRIADWLETHPDARLVIVDVFTKVRGAAPHNVGQYEADYGAMSALKAIADHAGVPCVVVHHTRKQDATDYLDTVSGTHGLAGAADAIMVLTRSRGSASATLKVTGRDIEEATHALDFDHATGTWALLDGPAQDYEMSDTRRRVLSLLRHAEPMSPKAIADELEIKDATARQTCKRMADDGQIDTAEGLYFVTEPPTSAPESDRSDGSDSQDQVTTYPLSPVTPVTLSPTGGL